MTTPTEAREQISRLQHEADLCANEGADDIAILLNDAAAMLTEYAALLEQAQPVAWCALTPSGKIAYFDGRPMVMPGPVGNDVHPVALYAAPAPALPPLTDENRKDAERGRFMLKHGGWYRSDEQTRLAVLVPHGSDLSCYAMRVAAIDAAMDAERKVRGE